jgi:membrane protein YqaA with SNARE-associated domain
MSWWAVLIVAGLGVLGMFAGWAVGSFLLTFRDEPHDIWEDWED